MFHTELFIVFSGLDSPVEGVFLTTWNQASIGTFGRPGPPSASEVFVNRHGYGIVIRSGTWNVAFSR